MAYRVEFAARQAVKTGLAVPFQSIDRAGQFVFMCSLDHRNFMAAQDGQNRCGQTTVIDMQMGNVGSALCPDLAIQGAGCIAVIDEFGQFQRVGAGQICDLWKLICSRACVIGRMLPREPGHRMATLFKQTPGFQVDPVGSAPQVVVIVDLKDFQTSIFPDAAGVLPVCL